ncbi:MAG: Methylthioribose-1-phosphate isomerase [Phycisphaerae bacterium]|nr:Methylthioribose-1-phosphate isomerase [Phycisphaerae bacterium]
MSLPRTIEWLGDLNGHVRLIDQTLLPGRLAFVDCSTVEQIWEAIKVLRVRGAPAIGIAGAMGLVLAIRQLSPLEAEAGFFAELERQRDYLASCRPTAVNLRWALDRLVRAAREHRGLGVLPLQLLLWEEARKIRDEDAAACRAIGEHGAHLIPDGGGVLTHCNAGSLATAELGTALALMYVAHERGRRFQVFADETRPLLQGARLTAWELQQAGIAVTVICDNMAATVMKRGQVQCVVTGADRIAANGDTANKIGTYGVALLARAHRIPFYVAAPVSTFDLNCPSGEQIPIEERAADEVRQIGDRIITPAEATVYNPAFDVTPAEFITAFISERGVFPASEIRQRFH